MTAIPYGLQFQALFVKDSWVFCSPNKYNINNDTFNTKTTVQVEFIKLLEKSGLTMEHMSKDSVYTFIMGVNEFSAIPLKVDYLILKAIYKSKDKDSTD